jgi:hypothetical protein
MHSTLVQDWFGPQFQKLHPTLQALHRHGGRLRGQVEVRVGQGAVAGWLGRRIAIKMGVPVGAKPEALEVTISHTASDLVWSRAFIDAQGNAHPMVSTFKAVGHWPDGHWLEHSGALQFKLTVDILEGGWHWRVLAARLHGVPLPTALLPQSRAYKRIEDQRYRFQVRFVAPIFGELLSYHGLLDIS